MLTNIVCLFQPAMYNYDSNDMSHYSSGSMAYFPTSTDLTMGGAIPSRDNTSSAFQAQTEQAKYVPPRGGASNLGSAVTVSYTQQTQQQQGKHSINMHCNILNRALKHGTKLYIYH